MLEARSGRWVSLTAACFLLAACSPSNGASTPTPGLAKEQTLRFPIQHDVNTLDPAQIDSETEAEIAHNLFDGLVKFDSNMNVVPDIASATDVSPDGLTYTFKLRPDVTFSNGGKVTSQDVLYSLNRAVAIQGPYASNLSPIAGYDQVATNQASGVALEALLEKKDPSVWMSGLKNPDPNTVVVKLSNAAGWFLSALAQPGVVGMIVDENAVKADVANWWSKPDTLVGTGAFKMTARTAYQSLDFAALPNWWGTPKPTLTGVHLDVVADPQTAVGKYEQGSYDIFGYGAYSATVADLVRIQSIPAEKQQLLSIPSNKTYWASFNMVADAKRLAGGPFTLDQGKSSHDLRLAFALAVDKTKLAKDLCMDAICMPATGGVIPKGMLGYLGDGADPLAAFDPGKARTLLASADPTGSKTKNLVYAYDPENPFNEPTAKFLQTEWQANLNITVTVQAVPRSRFITERLRGAYVLSRDGWAAGYNHPEDWFDNLWGASSGCPDSSCTTGYDTKAYDELLSRADAETLPAAITDYKALSHKLIDDIAYVPLFYTVESFLIKPYVLGAGANNLFDFYWDQIQLISH